MPSSNVRYKKSTEDIENHGNDVNVRPLGGGYSRFSVLERVLIVLLCVLLVLAIAFCILYAMKEAEKRSGSDRSVCLSEDCVRTASVILNSLDRKVKPCYDFYQFSCGNWIENEDISSFENKANQFTKVSWKAEKFTREKLEDKGTLEEYKENEAVSKALKYYFSCLEDEQVNDRIKEKRAYDLIRQYGSWNITDPQWQNSGWKLMPNLLMFHLNLESNGPLFFSTVLQDHKNSSAHVIVLTQRHTPLILHGQDRKNTTKAVKKRADYKNLMLSVITKLANTTKDDPDVSRQVKDIFNFEKQLAEISVSWFNLKEEDRRRRITLKELQEYTGKTFNWLDFFQKAFQEIGVNINEETFIEVSFLSYLKSMSAVLGKTDDVVLGNYFAWRVIYTSNSLLSKNIQEEFHKFQRSSRGTVANPPRWKYCLDTTRLVLGLPLSMLYVGKHFGGEKLKHVEKMVKQIREAFTDNIRNMKWMDDETKAAALRKAKAVKQNIGYPKILFNQEELDRKYKELDIDENDYFVNFMNSRRYQLKEIRKLLLQPVDRNMWSIHPDEANAFYKAEDNKIVFPAGILQAPFFDASRPKSINYGSIGTVIGHELSHSFSKQGREYDEHGEKVNWWSNSSLQELKNITKCLEDKYSAYKFYNLQVDGKRTLDENIADTGGIKQAFQAYEEWTKNNGQEPRLPALNMTNQQLFFVSFAQTWCAKYRPTSRQNAVKQPHAPEKYRIIGSLTDFPEFSKAFNCPASSRMNPRKKCNLWS